MPLVRCEALQCVQQDVLAFPRHHRGHAEHLQSDAPSSAGNGTDTGARLDDLDPIARHAERLDRAHRPCRRHDDAERAGGAWRSDQAGGLKSAHRYCFEPQRMISGATGVDVPLPPPPSSRAPYARRPAGMGPRRNGSQGPASRRSPRRTAAGRLGTFRMWTGQTAGRSPE